MNRERIDNIDSLMKLARNKGLQFVPELFTSAKNGESCMIHSDRLWELTTWMPGSAANPAQVSREQVESAFAALALLHGAWAHLSAGRAPCPGVLRRIQACREWEKLVQSGWRVPIDCADPALPWAERAFKLLEIHSNKIPRKLESWLDRPISLQPCLCDIWCDHVLFEGNMVTGVVDYGGVKTDHVAVDLARLLGSLVEDRAELRAAGLRAYSRLRPISLEEEELVTVLDVTGTLVGLITWLKWLYLEGKQFDDRAAAAKRLQALVERIEKW
jgi:homoserine kinase type II